MTCKQLGGACEEQFRADTFAEIASQSKQHGMEMFKAGDQGHLLAMQEMQKLMQSPDAMQQWMNEKKMEFDALPEDE